MNPLPFKHSEGNRPLRRRANLLNVTEKKKRGRPPRQKTTILTIDVDPELADRFREKAKKRAKTHEQYLEYLVDLDN